MGIFDIRNKERKGAGKGGCDLDDLDNITENPKIALGICVRVTHHPSNILDSLGTVRALIF